MIFNTAAELARALMSAENAHKLSGSSSDNWAEWYADYLFEKEWEDEN